MSHHIKAPVFISCIAASLLTACVSESQNDYAYTSDTSSAADTAYTGSRSPAHMTMSTSRDFTSHILGSEDIGGLVGARPTANRTSYNLSGLLKQQQYLLDIATPHARLSSLQQRSTITQNCLSDGTMTLTEDINQTTNLGSLTFEFSACRNTTSDQIDGQMTMIVAAVDAAGNPTDFTLNMENLSVTEGSLRNSITGSIRSLQSTASITTTSNLYSFNHSDNTQSFQDLEQVDAAADSITGRFYSSNYGYILLSSSSNLILDSEGNISQGYLYLQGSDGSIARVSKSSGANVLVELDEDGDGTYEQQEIIDTTI